MDGRERRDLCDLFLELGPDAPTLCEGWDALDLASHLVIRERDLRAPLAIMGGSRFRSLEERLMGGAADRGLPTLVERLRGGPPLVPWRLPGLRQTLNLNEWFVHHEDLRRANDLTARPEDADLDAALWAQMGRAGRFLVRAGKDLALSVSASGHGEQRLSSGTWEAQLRGPVPELVLYLNGRRDAADVEISGSPEARDALAAAQLGI